MGSPSAPVRVFLVDDHEVVRRGVAEVLEDDPEVTVAGEAGSVAEALVRVPAVRPDVVVIDMRLPDGDGAELCRGLRERLPDLRCLVLTSYSEQEALDAAVRAGASGFLLKDAPAEELAAAIRVIASGESLLAPGVTRRVIDAFLQRHAPAARPVDRRMALLTPRELEVLGLMARGRSNAEISTALFVSEATTKTHVSNVLAKLRLRDRVQAVIFAYESGLVVPGGTSTEAPSHD